MSNKNDKAKAATNGKWKSIIKRVIKTVKECRKNDVEQWNRSEHGPDARLLKGDEDQGTCELLGNFGRIIKDVLSVQLSQ